MENDLDFINYINPFLKSMWEDTDKNYNQVKLIHEEVLASVLENHPKNLNFMKRMENLRINGISLNTENRIQLLERISVYNNILRELTDEQQQSLKKSRKCLAETTRQRISPKQARIINFDSICHLLSKKELSIDVAKQLNYKQAATIDAWYSNRPNKIATFSELMDIIQEPKNTASLYKKLCYPTLFTCFTHGLLSLEQIRQLSDFHCFALIRNKDNIQLLFDKNLLNVDQFIHLDQIDLNSLEKVTEAQINRLLSKPTTGDEVLNGLSNNLGTLLATLRSESQQEISSHLDDNVAATKKRKRAEVLSACKNSQYLINMEFISEEWADNLNQVELFIISAWEEYPTKFSYEDLIRNLKSWTHYNAMRWPQTFHASFIKNIMTEAQWDMSNSHMRMFEKYYYSFILPMIDSGRMTMQDFADVDQDLIEILDVEAVRHKFLNHPELIFTPKQCNQYAEDYDNGMLSDTEDECSDDEDIAPSYYTCH